MSYLKKWVSQISNNSEKLQFWKKLLADDWYGLESESKENQWIESILQKVYKSFCADGRSRLWDAKFVYAYESISIMFNGNITKENMVFETFYEPWLDWVQTKLIHLDINGIYTKQCRFKILEICNRRFNEIACRILINDMNVRKKEGLYGNTSQERYNYYCEHYLKKSEYHRSLCQTYPVLVQLLDKSTQDLVTFFDEIRQHLQQDKDEIIYKLCQQRTFEHIQSIECGIADVHSDGRTVVRLCLDNGRDIFYKPHTVQQDRIFSDIYQWFCEILQIKIRPMQMIMREDHAWIEAIAHEKCQDIEEVHQFYKRLGVWLFCCYILSVGDMHYENVIANGAYPMIIDMETVPGIVLQKNNQEAQSLVYWMDKKITQSVLMTQLLPAASEVQNGYNENISAIGAENGQILSLRIPVIEHAMTSDMCIVYKHPVIQNNYAVPIFQEKNVQARNYMNDLCEGFNQAYQIGQSYRKQLLQMAEPLFDIEARVVLRDTQEYQMVKMLATYPIFLTSPENRVMLLTTLRKQNIFTSDVQQQILTDEIMNLYMQYIPIYWHHENDIHTSEQNILKNCISDNARDLFMYKLSQLDELDRHFQNQLIEISMSLTDNNAKRKINIANIMEELIKRCVVCPYTEQMGWLNLSKNHSGKCQIMPMDMYLYDGICGVIVYIAAYLHCHYKEIQIDQVQVLFDRLTEQLFAYTDKMLSEQLEIMNLNTGIMCGESSIVYTYLLLCKLTGKTDFKAYAVKHMTILKKIWKSDTNYDLLSGNAGLLIVCIHMFAVTKDSSYMAWAEDIAEWLLNQSVKQKQGIGWKIPECDYPLAGLAHGCSGFLLAFSRLYKVTENYEWEKCIKDILIYENSLFNSEHMNWNDLRNMDCSESKTFCDFSAWCHGAPGILIAREEMLENMRKDEVELHQIVQKNIVDAKKKIKQTKSERGCLCHGTMGLWHISPSAFESPVYISVQEWHNNGFMTGISGMGYELLYAENSALPDILRLKIE